MKKNKLTNFLSLDFSTKNILLFFSIDGLESFKDISKTFASGDSLVDEILKFFSENNRDLNDISHIFVNLGPGSYSGLRSSIAAAKGLSISKNLNIYGFNTFLLSGKKFENLGKPFVCVLVLNNKYFMQKFDNGLKFKINPIKINECEIINNLKYIDIIIPESFVKFLSPNIRKMSNLHTVKLEYADLIELKNRNFLEKKLIKPIYLS